MGQFCIIKNYDEHEFGDEVNSMLNKGYEIKSSNASIAFDGEKVVEFYYALLEKK